VSGRSSVNRLREPVSDDIVRICDRTPRPVARHQTVQVIIAIGLLDRVYIEQVPVRIVAIIQVKQSRRAVPR